MRRYASCTNYTSNPTITRQLLEKKVPKTTKYNEVKSKLDTGNTVDKVVQKIGEHAISKCSDSL